MNNKDICSVFGNRERLGLIVCLKKPQNVSTLLTRCSLAQSALSQHLRILKDAGIVSATKKGREVTYKTVHADALKIASLLIRL